MALDCLLNPRPGLVCSQTIGACAAVGMILNIIGAGS
jgi:hypothetical protein